jgi:CPA1 family monovalent cation:H+ antiporter
MQSNIQELELVFILLLIFVVGFGSLASRMKTPYPILMVIGGLVLSLIPGIPRFSLDPDIIFFAVLPPLLFGAAANTSWRDFRYNLVSIFSLAFGLVGFTVFGVALISRWILPGFDWRLGLVLGAVVSTTDAIAATSIAQRVGLPRRIIDVLEGESLINDASGLLALEFAVALVVTGQTPSLAMGAGRLIYLIAGGIGTGLILGKIIDRLEHYIDDSPIEITISLVTPYVAYLAADNIRASGVLSVVACGLFLGRRSATFFSSVVRIEAQAFWNTLTFALNGIVFVLIGFQLPYVRARIGNVRLQDLLLEGALFSGAVIVLRLIWVYPGAYISYIIRRRVFHQAEPNPSWRSLFIAGWTGMRGVVALAAAISLPATMANGMPFPERDAILFLTFCVIFVTLVLQGLTLPALIRALRVTGPSTANCELSEARKIMVEAALGELQKSPEREFAELKTIYEDVESHYRARLVAANNAIEGKAGEGGTVNLYEQITRRYRVVERAAAIKLRDQDRISDEVLRDLLRNLDLLDARGKPGERPNPG